MTPFYDTKEYASLSDKVYHHLRDDITEGRYHPGDYLVELKIADELNVSRTPVREALKQLELEGLVSSQPNRGVVVIGITNEDIRDVFTIRHLLEGQAAYWAAERISDQQLDQLSELVELMDLYTRKNDTEHLVRLDSKFHEVIYEACNSKTLYHILTSLHQNIHRARQSSLGMPNRAPNSLEEHRSIFSALERHDADAAKSYMEQHVTYAAESGETKPNV